MKKGAAAVGVLTLIALMLIPVEDPNVQVQHGLALYHDPSLTAPCTSIVWGTLTPESSKSKITYLVSNSNASIIFSTHSWNPENAPSYLRLTWNITGYVYSNITTPILWTLYASPNITVLSFNFKINITIME